MSLEKLPGIGKQTATHLARLEIYSIEDLLFHFPLRYQDRTEIHCIRQLIPGREAVIEGVIKTISTPQQGRTKLLCEVRDETGVIFLRFFHLLSFQLKILKPGARLRCYSQIQLGQKGLEMIHPEFQILIEGKLIPVEQYFTPIYPATVGLGQYTLRKLTGNALIWMEKSLSELIPDHLLQTLELPRLKDALQSVHRPYREIPIPDLLAFKTSAQQRVIFEELLAYRISLLRMRQMFQEQVSVALIQDGGLLNAFRKQLPFQLTNAQERVIHDIKIDLMQTHPMLRLIQGDVGSGKTIVAAFAMLQTVENGYQAALMAPTELLAEQHYRVFKKWLDPLGLHIAFLSSQVKARTKTNALKSIENGEASIVIGTHALFQQDINFYKLALVIVDEQHRFGVQQRALLREKGMQKEFFPHQLMMTATPIPRTLAMSFYADLDCSTIDELPPGRTPVVTSIIASDRRREVIARIQTAFQEGRQAYWVCPLIEESELLDCQAATKTAEQLQQALPKFKVGLIHGRMKALEKECVMQAFQCGDMQLLVATTVIEVGVDVPNASLMIIENAERLGLSQLHQLRGRVGRGTIASYCLLLYQQPLSELAKERLSVMRETTDGFKIAQRDLELRGPGEVLGTRQTGALTFKVADLLRDNAILPKVQHAAREIMRDYPDTIEPLIERWIGEKKEYGKI